MTKKELSRMKKKKKCSFNGIRKIKKVSLNGRARSLCWDVTEGEGKPTNWESHGDFFFFFLLESF